MSYPALTSLGINRPHEITSYTLSTNNNEDTLRIRYQRQKGSLLPTSKRFTFPRRPLGGVQVIAGEQPMTEISPALEASLTELSQLLCNKETASDKKEDLLQEIHEFETYVATKMAQFKAEIKNI